MAPVTGVPGTTHTTAGSTSGSRNAAFSLAGGSLPSCKLFPASEEEFQPLTALKSPRCPSGCGAVPRCARRIPAASHPCASRCHPAAPGPRRAAAPRATTSPSSTGGPRGRPGLSWRPPRAGTSPPTADPALLRWRRQGGRGADGAKPNPSTSSPGELYGPESRSTASNSLIGGSLQPTIIQRLICAHLLQREQYVLMGSLLC